MKQSFRKLWYRLLVGPFALPMLLGYLPLVAAGLLLGQPLLFLPALVWVLLLEIANCTASRGRPAWLAVQLSPNFYAVRTFTGRYSVFQRRTDMGASPDCRALLRSLVAEQRTLPARLPPGRYRTITHGTVLRRLQAMETAGEITAIPIYTATLKSIRKQMTGGHCKRCRAVCPLRTGAEKPRMFYYVRFRIACQEETPSAAT